MNHLKYLSATALVMVLAACGGGGGSAGTTDGAGNGTGTGTTDTDTTIPVTSGSMTFELVNSAGTAVAGKNLSLTETQYLQATVKDAKGAVVPYMRVTFALDSSEAVLVPVNGVQLTNEFGIAQIKVAPANVGSQGVVGATAVATVNGSEITQSFDMSITPGQVQLETLLLTPKTLQKGQALNASVNVLVNGVAASSNSVGVTFSSNCGNVGSMPALVDATGKASTVVQTTATGDCQVTATYNSTSQVGSFTVTAPPITALSFISASPELIYQSGSAGAKTSIVSFKVVDSLNDGIPSVPVSVRLSNLDGGINFCDGKTTAQANSSSDGVVSFSVCSGTLPATVQIHAELKNDSGVFADSNLLTIQTGLPTQRFFDISANDLNIYAGGEFTDKFNGNETDITVFAADRQGNPVPAGTPIVFVSEGGQLTTSGSSSCIIADNGRCSVKLVGQNYRPLGSPIGDPRPGRVTVLAYTDGEESFVDANYNNRHDAGELFENIGKMYLDKDESGSFSASYLNLVKGTDEGEFIYPVPASAIDTSACPSNSNVGLSVAKTCNKKWDGATKVRRAITIVFSGGEIGQPGNYHSTIPAENRTKVLSRTRGAIAVRLADLNGNPLPSKAGVTVEVSPSGDCKAKLSGTVIGNSLEPTEHVAILEECAGGESVFFKVTVQGKESSLAVTVP